MDKIVIFIVIGIILLGGIFWAFQSGFLAMVFAGPVKQVPVPEGILLFYGQDCPHCKIVEDFITANGIDQKVKFSKLEVPFNGKTSSQLVANAGLALQLAKGCKLDVNNVGIPFLYDGKQCFVGQDDVINFFKNAANIK